MRSSRAPRRRARSAPASAPRLPARASARRADPPRSAPWSTRAARSATGGARDARASEPAWQPSRDQTWMSLEVSAQRLFPLDRLEQRLEVAVAEAAGAVAFDHLEEHRRPVLRRLREDLQQVAVVVSIGEDPVPPQNGIVLVDFAHSGGHLFVIGIRRVEEDHPALFQRLDRTHDVRRGERDMLCAGAAVELEVLLDLALALAL